MEVEDLTMSRWEMNGFLLSLLTGRVDSGLWTLARAKLREAHDEQGLSEGFPGNSTQCQNIIVRASSEDISECLSIV